jgi:hypothetical protein
VRDAHAVVVIEISATLLALRSWRPRPHWQQIQFVHCEHPRDTCLSRGYDVNKHARAAAEANALTPL